MAVAVRSEVRPGSEADVRFHSRCGKNAVVENGGKTARRINEIVKFREATVLTNIPLKEFEVELVERIESWSGSVMIGFTTHAPDRIEFPKDMTYMTSGTWMIQGRSVIHCGHKIKQLGHNIRNLVVGQRVGVMRKEGGDMLLFIDGREVELAAKEVPSNLYGVVDICGCCVAVKLTSPSVDLNPKHLKQAKDLARQDGVQLKNVETLKSDDPYN